MGMFDDIEVLYELWMEYQAWFREGQLRDLVVGPDHEPGLPPGTPE